MKWICFAFLLFCSGNINAQEPRRVVDATTGEPIAFATIKVLHAPGGAMADEAGVFSLSCAPADTVVVSRVGYRGVRLTGQDLEEAVYLQRDSQMLQPVLVRQSVPVRTIRLGNGVPYLGQDIGCSVSGDGADSTLFCLPWRSMRDQMEFAERMVLPDSTKAYRLLRVIMPTRGRRLRGKLLLHLYDADSAGGPPGPEFFLREVLITPKNTRNNKVYFDLSAAPAWIQQRKQFFVGLSFGGRGEGSGISMALYRLPENNSFSRTLARDTYDWFPAIWWTSKIKYSTAYVVELEERIYK